VVADIPESESAEEGVAKGVDSYVSVRMGHEADRTLDAHSSEPHRQTFSYRMYIISVTDSERADVLIHDNSKLIRKQKYGKNAYLC
jgi:hypothetical protein